MSPEEMIAFEGMDDLYKKGSSYAVMMVTRPQTLGYSLRAPRLVSRHGSTTSLQTGRTPIATPSVSLRDEMLDDITLYWLTNTATSASRLYWENNANNFNAVDISIPAAITVFPGEI